MRHKLLINTILAILLLASFTSAAGVASLYNRANPLEMNYGETKVINLNLQNMVGNEDVTFEVSVKEGSDIASLDQTRYTVAAKTADTIVPVTISVPENYPENVKRVEIDVKTVTPDQGGTVTLGTGMTVSFNVILSEKPELASSSAGLIIFLIIAVIVLLLIIIFFLIKKRR